MAYPPSDFLLVPAPTDFSLGFAPTDFPLDFVPANDDQTREPTELEQFQQQRAKEHIRGTDINLSLYFETYVNEHGETRLQCKGENCYQTFSKARSADAQRHLTSKEGSCTPQIHYVAGWCPVCGQSFGQAAHYKNHYRLKHDDSPEKFIFSCDGENCTERFRERNEALRHSKKCPDAKVLKERLQTQGEQKPKLWSGSEKEYHAPPILTNKAHADIIANSSGLFNKKVATKKATTTKNLKRSNENDGVEPERVKRPAPSSSITFSTASSSEDVDFQQLWEPQELQEPQEPQEAQWQELFPCPPGYRPAGAPENYWWQEPLS